MRRAALLLLAALALSACSREGEEVDPGFISSGRVIPVEVHLNDGRVIPCITYTQGAMSCDWSGR